MNRRILAGAAVLLTACVCACADRKSIYPVEEDTTLTYWTELNSVVASMSSNLGDTEFAKTLEKQTGIKVQFIHTEADNTKEAFRLLLASRNLPDIIEGNWTHYPGGTAQAVADGCIISIDRLMEEYSPNFTALLRDNPDLEKEIMLTDGGINYYPFLRLDDKLLVTRGLVIRKDWLDELGMAVPETVDEWTEVLRAFKNIKGAEAPISFVGTCLGFLEAYGITNEFYIEDGVVRNGVLQQGYKDFLTQMNEWYEEGLIAENFVSLDEQAVEMNMLSGKSGACFTHAGSGMGRWLESANKPEGFDLVGTQFPVLNKGDTPLLGYKDLKVSGLGTAISTMCRNTALAARLLDYGYSEEGHMLYNFGVENESYTMTDGIPTFTDKIHNAPDGAFFGDALAQYARSSYSGPFVQDVRYLEQYYTHPQQLQAVSAWSVGREPERDISEIKLSAEENNEILSLMVGVSDYATEMYSKLILGAASFDEYDAHIERLKELGLDRVLEIYNNALAAQKK